MKAKWGEWLTGNLVVAAALLTVFLILLIILFPIIAILVFTKHIVPAVIFGILAFTLLATFNFIVITLESIYQLVLYRYAADGLVCAVIEEGHLKNAFTSNPPKRKMERMNNGNN